MTLMIYRFSEVACLNIHYINTKGRRGLVDKVSDLQSKVLSALKSMNNTKILP
jgi:hypothetical protein